MTEKPNFLYFITDQHRSDYLGCAGHPILKTPNIDSIAEQGTRFERFFVASPVCMPNRASLLTGRFPSVNGLRYNGNHLTYRANTFVDVLANGGYRTAHIGKSHVQPMTNFPPYERVDPAALGLIEEAWKDDDDVYDQELPSQYSGEGRFEIRKPYYGYQHVDMVTKHGDMCGGHYEQWFRELAPNWKELQDRKNELAHNYSCPQAYRTPIPEELYSTSFIRDKAKAYLSEQAKSDDPFFAFVSFPDPHHPFNPPGKYWDMYNPADFEMDIPYTRHQNPPPPMRHAHQQLLDETRDLNSMEGFMVHEQEIREAKALTCGMITMIDDAVGEILEVLRDTGKLDNTVLIFNSDHGDYLGDFNMLLKGALQMNSITQVPFVWSDPGNRDPLVQPKLASTIDIGPTILERAGLKPYWGIQGQSQLSAIRGEKEARDSVMIEFHDSGARMGFDQPAFVRTLVTQDWRLTLYKDQDWGELYNLENDPIESQNLWDDAKHHGTKARLIEQLLQHMMSAVDQSPRSLKRA
ncbi:MAG: sulfatase family protein [Methyloligellaceae bacterium]